MKFKKITITILLILILCIVFVLFCNKPEINIDYKNSFYSTYYTKDDKVYIQCELTINNNTKISRNIQIIGIFEDDADLGLLKTPKLYGYDTDLITNKFNIDSGSQKISVTFIGDYNGVNLKHDRNLPKIQLIYQ